MKKLEEIYKPYRRRETKFLGVRELLGYSLKFFSVSQTVDPFRWKEFEPGLAMALEFLPTPAVSHGRPGLGFLIAHRGEGVNYVILCWWDQENELPTKVFVEEGSSWRPAATHESFCVWDLEIMWREREAYVSTILRTGETSMAEEYLSTVTTYHDSP